MSTKITLESRQRLPSKVQDVICDSALIIQHATSASGSSEMLNSCSKQFCAAEQSIGTTSTSLNKMDSLLDAMQQQCYEVENRYGALIYLSQKSLVECPNSSIWIINFMIDS
ncbi:hypothetical protein RB195_021702 [Necator americanus]|uniref:BLOC-1-related complex subunit 7 n=1 Tax=Necator americanus TaxID=51031 RepID=A0ABR1ECE3_NECAM